MIMKRIFITGAWVLVIFLLIQAGVSFAQDAQQAQDTSKNWRPIYDIVMMWFNFGILAFLIYKFGKQPIMSFLKGQRENIELELEKMHKSKAETMAALDELQKNIDEKDKRIEEIKQRVIAEAESQRQKIVADAKQDAMKMIEEAKNKVDIQMNEARQAFRKEMLEVAFNIASDQIKTTVSPSDKENFVEQYIDSIKKP
jgi:F-type H+-transporting ATPase subunit b